MTQEQYISMKREQYDPAKREEYAKMAPKSPEELGEWYNKFKETLQKNNIDLSDKSQMYRVRYVSTVKDGDMRLAFNMKDGDCTYETLLDLNNKDFQKAYEDYLLEKSQNSRALAKANQLEGAEKDGAWAEAMDQSNRIEKNLDKYLDDRFGKKLEEQMQGQELPENKGIVEKWDHIEKLYNLAQKGQLFIMPEDPTDTQDFRQIYNNENGEIVVSDKESTLVKKGCNMINAQKEYAEKHGEPLLELPVMPELGNGYKELGDPPPKPSALRRFLCEHFAIFNRLLGQKVIDYDNYMADVANNQRLLAERDQKWNEYFPKLDAYQAQVDAAQNEIFPQRGLYPNCGKKIPQLRQMAEKIHDSVADKYNQDKLMSAMADGDMTAGATKKQQDRKNAYLRRQQTWMTVPGRYDKDGKLTEAGAQERAYQREHVFSMDETLASHLSTVEKKLGSKISCIDVKETRRTYAQYIYLSHIKEATRGKTEEEKREMFSRLAPWNLEDGTQEILEDSAFSATLEKLNNTEATLADLLKDYHTANQWKNTPAYQAGHAQRGLMKTMADGSQAKSLLNMGQQGYLAMTKTDAALSEKRLAIMACGTMLHKERTAGNGQPGPMEQQLEKVGTDRFVDIFQSLPGVKDKIQQWQKDWTQTVNDPNFLSVDEKTVQGMGKALGEAVQAKSAQKTKETQPPELKQPELKQPGSLGLNS